MAGDADTTDAADHWTSLRVMAEAGRVQQMIETIRSIPDIEERIALYRSTIRHLSFDDWANRDPDVMIALADEAIAECEALGGAFVQQANVLCFNMAANLADCWADEFAREPRHFEKGIEYARKALVLRKHLQRGPGGESGATWALGKHQQSLGRMDEARESFARCLALATEAATAAGEPAGIVPGAPDGYLIAAGYVALMASDFATLSCLRELLDARIAKGGEVRADAQIIVGQLRETGRQLSIEF